MIRYLIVLVLTISCLFGCNGFKILRGDDLDKADKLIQSKKYQEALEIYDRTAREASGTDRGAKALFSAAKLHSFYDNPRKDYARSLQEFEEFLRKYPANENVREVQNWRSFLKTILELRKENERLADSIEQLKRVDIRPEERRKGK